MRVISLKRSSLYLRFFKGTWGVFIFVCFFILCCMVVRQKTARTRLLQVSLQKQRIEEKVACLMQQVSLYEKILKQVEEKYKRETISSPSPRKRLYDLAKKCGLTIARFYEDQKEPNLVRMECRGLYSQCVDFIKESEKLYGLVHLQQGELYPCREEVFLHISFVIRKIGEKQSGSKI